MTEKLDNMLAETLQNFLNGLQTAQDFATAQLPDVINQLLTWYFTYYIILAIIAIALFIVQIIGSYYWITKVEPKLPSSVQWAGTVFGVGVGGGVLLIIEILMLNLTWLKIWIAPKIWLIEYTSSLLKG